ncbi:MAG: hypothetical protein KDJ26_04040 [Alphaproteobacteria bacterium]|jgi:hypothetical protein|nr:hypothetical protein [Alphaproteobacteria bacterium]MCB1551153.1 hypothetical protein [Alphaproteobacteria bacterium]MCB9985379.1 hypothetical protein [Micavibrio sp.]
MPKKISQSADHIWMTEPVLFHCNKQTMATNTYQTEDPPDIEEVQRLALAEFRNLRDRLVAAGISVTTTLGAVDSPDDIFPNWASTHVTDQGERVIVYFPMLNKNRRIERRPHMMNLLERSYRVALDMTSYEVEDRALESTSALWMDRIHKVAYSSLSARADRELAQKWCDFMGYQFVPFETRNHVGKPVYHTDVLMFIGTEFIGVCLDCIVPEDRARVRASLEATGREIVEITMDQLREFCGNSLELTSKDGTQKLLMSGSAYRAYTDAQKAVFLKYVSEIIYTDLPTIQKYGGGAARCMIMELF